MAFTWQWLALPGLVAFAGTLSIALAVWRTNPERPLNQRLSLLAFLVGFLSLVMRPMRLLLEQSQAAQAMALAGLVLTALLPLVYARFLLTLNAPLARVFKHPVGMALVRLHALFWMAAIAILPGRVIVGMEPFSHVTAWSFIPGWAATLELMTTAFLLFSFAVVISAVRHARTDAKRNQLRRFAVAIGVHDFLLAGWLLFISIDGRWNDPLTDNTALGNYLTFLIEPTAALLFAVLLGYGILRYQVLGIDLKLKAAATRSVVFGAIALTLIVVAEIIEQFVVGGSAGTIGGIVAAALLATGFRPLERAAGRLMDRLMPNVRDTPEYRAHRAREIYVAAAEAAFADGTVTDKERDVLDELAAQLGLADRESKTLERQASGVSAS